MTRDLSKLLKPKSIAVVGGAWAENVLEQLQKSGFKGDIWAVNPKRSEIGGVQCFASLRDLPSAPDAAFVGVNRSASIDVVKQLSEMGAGGATCFASGFSESEGETSGGADLQEALIEAAGDMPIFGPNCYGMLNYLDNIHLWPDQHGGRPCERGVAIIGQSSNILINLTMQKRGLPIAYTIAVGNQAQTGFSEIGLHLLDDPRVTALGLFIEGFGDIRSFEALVKKAHALGKPIIAIKSGKSEASKLATLTHTASLSGSAAASSAFLKRNKIVEVSSLGSFIEALKIVHSVGHLTGNEISSMSCSGGEAGLMADITEQTDLNLRDFSSTATEQLKTVLGPIVTIANPLDYHTYIWGNAEAMTETFSAVFADDFDFNIVVMDIPPSDRCDWNAWEVPLQAVIAASQKTKGKVGLLATLPENLSENISDQLMSKGVVPLHGIDDVITAIDAIIKAQAGTPVTGEPALLASSPIEKVETLDEAQSKSELAKFGLQFPNMATAERVEELSAAIKELSFPMVLKGLGFSHKSEANAVILNLNTTDELLQAAHSIKNADGFLIEEMVTGVVAEMLVGITRDETALFVLTIGAGGVLTELISDTKSLIIPADRFEIEAALDELKISNLLNGYRGKPAANKSKLVDAICAIQEYCMANTSLIELDVNPLMALEDDAIAVDALIVREKQT